MDRGVSRFRYASPVTTPIGFDPANNIDAEKAQASGDVLRPLGQCAARKVTSSKPVNIIPTSVLTRASLANTAAPSAKTQDFTLVDRVTDAPKCPPSEDVANADGTEKREWTTFSELAALVSTAKTLLYAEQPKQSRVIRDLLTDRLISVPIALREVTSTAAASEDLISFDEPKRSPVPALSQPPNKPAVNGSVPSAKAGQSITVRCFALPESEKHEKVCLIVLEDAYDPAGRLPVKLLYFP